MTDVEMSEAQNSDIAAAWVGARVYTQDYANDNYHVIVVSRGGTVLADYDLALTEDGETVTPIHWLKSLKGEKLSAANLESLFGVPRQMQYNAITGELKA